MVPFSGDAYSYSGIAVTVTIKRNAFWKCLMERNIQVFPESNPIFESLQDDTLVR